MGLENVHFTGDWETALSVTARDCDNVLLIVSPGAISRGTLAKAKAAINASNLSIVSDVPEMPDVTYIEELYERLKDRKFTCVVAIGGGSVIDTAKACIVAMNCHSTKELSQQLVTSSISIKIDSPLLFVAIPTTAGSGSEVTSFATIWDRDNLKKRSIQSTDLTPAIAIVDPHFLSTLSGDNLLYPALDAASHAIESLWSKRKTDSSRLHAITALGHSNEALRLISMSKPSDSYKALTLASVHAGAAIAESRTAISHSISYPITLKFGVPHGLATSFTLRAIFRMTGSHFDSQEMERQLIASVIDQIDSFDLTKRVNYYCDLRSILSMVPHMSTSGRADNFIGNLGDGDIVTVLSESLCPP
jgi:alcohol dehydrogenase class IV